MHILTVVCLLLSPYSAPLPNLASTSAYTPQTLNEPLEKPLLIKVRHAAIAFATQEIGLGTGALAILLAVAWRERSGKLRLRREIEERRATAHLLAEREKEYREIFEGAPLAFVVWDGDFRVRAWNRSAERIFGWKKSEVLGKRFTDFLVPGSLTTEIEGGIEKLRNEGSFSQINENRTQGGQTIWCQWHNVGRRDAGGEIIECHSIAADVTQQFKAQQRLELDHLRALNASEAKDQLLANTSHEIRNPLNAVMGYAQLLATDAPDKTTREMAQIVLEGAESMLNLLNDLLDTSKLEAGKMPIVRKETNLTDLVHAKAAAFRHPALNRGLTFDVTVPEAPVKIVTDARRVGQILTNLLSNATKFTNKGGIYVELTEPANEAGGVFIRVRDTGIGIEADAQEKIFEPFVQANQNISADFGGTGLGLSLSKRLAEALGGHLSLESAPGAGSCFTLFLPEHPHSPRSERAV